MQPITAASSSASIGCTSAVVLWANWTNSTFTINLDWPSVVSCVNTNTAVFRNIAFKAASCFLNNSESQLLSVSRPGSDPLFRMCVCRNVRSFGLSAFSKGIFTNSSASGNFSTRVVPHSTSADCSFAYSLFLNWQRHLVMVVRLCAWKSYGDGCSQCVHE